MQIPELKVCFQSPKAPQDLLSKIIKPYWHNFCCYMFETKYNVPDRQLKATLCFGLCSKQFIAVAPDKPWCILCYPYFTSHTMFNTAFPFLLHLINLRFSRLNQMYLFLLAVLCFFTCSPLFSDFISCRSCQYASSDLMNT